MTMSQESMADAAYNGQEAITNALQIWADNFQRFIPTSDAKLRGAVDNVFDFAEQWSMMVFATQRELTKGLLATTTKAAHVAKDAAKDMKNGAMDRRPSAAKDAEASGRKS